ncbi:MAG: outer membrane protein assembly factor [Prevotellaceae bacterium]|jgi:outer membrane protein assembly factor BamA|nr:outer membrane protein assembly factor [Prevotellaceae bacterium]
MSNKVFMNAVLYLSCFFCAIPQLYPQQLEKQIPAVSNNGTGDTVRTALTDKKKDSYWNRLIHGNIDRTFEKKMDISFIAAPSYTREASFGIGGMASGLYRIDRSDSILRPSNITLTFNASLLGFYSVTAIGNNYFKGGKSVLSYDVEFTTKPLNFWGISYDACKVNPVIGYTRRQIRIDANCQYKLSGNFYAGGILDFTYAYVSKIDNLSYLEGQKNNYLMTGLGISIQYDSRDFIPNPRRGVYLMLQQSIFPKQFSNGDNIYYRISFIADVYKNVWQGAIIAADFFGQFNPENSPWTLKEQLGGNQRMRGYYAGRYIDNSIVVGQIELRQHIVQRFGCAGWIGGGTVFPALDKFKAKNILPTCGIGLRYEFKHNVNIRIDYGFGHQTGGFVFNIGEAF